MSSYRDPPTRSDRAKAITAVIAIHVALAALVLTSQQPLPMAVNGVRTVLIEIADPPPPPPPPPPEVGRAAKEEGEAGKKAEPSPVVAPKPTVIVPALSPVIAAPVAGTGSAASAGNALAGTGTGAGGTGSGRGSGGSGLGENARLISGGLSRRDYRRFRAIGIPSGRAVLVLLVGPEGRIRRCAPRETSGDPDLDAALCDILAPRMVWSPARDRDGRPVTVDIYYTAIWSPD